VGYPSLPSWIWSTSSFQCNYLSSPKFISACQRPHGLPDPTNGHEATNLFSLLDELLLHVVHSLDTDEHQELLCTLSLVNRRLATVVRDEFYVSPWIKLNHAHKMAQKLLDEPDLAWKLAALTLPDSPPTTKETTDWSSDVSQPERGDTLSLTLRCLDAICLHGVTDDSWWTTGLQARDSYAHAAVVLAITPRLRTLTLPPRFASVLGRLEAIRTGFRGIPSRPYLMRVLQESSEHLETLIIRPSARPCYNIWNIKDLDLRPLKAIKHLDIPTATLPSDTREGNDGTQQTKYPPHVESIRLMTYGWYFNGLVRKLLIDTRKTLLFLRKLECEAGTIRNGLYEDLDKFMCANYDSAKDQGLALLWAYKDKD
jgi:hypothetical protein